MSPSPQWQAKYQQQEAVKARFHDESALQDGLMSAWQVRIDALRMLAFQRRDDEVIAVALSEQDAPAVLDFALAVALPASPALITHRLAMRKSPPSMDMGYYYPCGNFLYAEQAIMKRVAASPMRLQATVLAGFGLAGFTSAIPLLRKHVAISGLRTRAMAQEAGDSRAAKNELGGADHLDRQWDGPSERAIESLLALARLGAAIDVDLARALYQQTTALLPSPVCGGNGAFARGQLATVLFHAGAIGLDEARENRADAGDVLTALLRRGDEEAATAWAKSPEFRIRSKAFHFWPALDFASPPGYAQRGIFGGFERDVMYPLSRDAGVAPPPWWQWRTPWTRSDSARVLRGELRADG
jgi:hypothetical protein